MSTYTTRNFTLFLYGLDVDILGLDDILYDCGCDCGLVCYYNNLVYVIFNDNLYDDVLHIAHNITKALDVKNFIITTDGE